MPSSTFFSWPSPSSSSSRVPSFPFSCTSMLLCMLAVSLMLTSSTTSAASVSKRSVNFTPSWGKRAAYAPGPAGDGDFSLPAALNAWSRSGSGDEGSACAAEAGQRIETLFRRLQLELQSFETCLRSAASSSPAFNIQDLANLN